MLAPLFLVVSAAILAQVRKSWSLLRVGFGQMVYIAILAQITWSLVASPYPLPLLLLALSRSTQQCRQAVVPDAVVSTPGTSTPPVERSDIVCLSSTTPPHSCVTARQASAAPESLGQPPPLTRQQSLLVAMFDLLSRPVLCRVVLATWVHTARNMDALQNRAQSKHHKSDGSILAAASMVATTPSSLSPTSSASSARCCCRRSCWSPEPLCSCPALDACSTSALALVPSSLLSVSFHVKLRFCGIRIRIGKKNVGVARHALV